MPDELLERIKREFPAADAEDIAAFVREELEAVCTDLEQQASLISNPTVQAALLGAAEAIRARGGKVEHAVLCLWCAGAVNKRNLRSFDGICSTCGQEGEVWSIRVRGGKK
jgi:hypothetical protein